MTSNDFTSGPVRDLTPEELGVSGFSDFELLSDTGHNLVYRAIWGGKWVVLKAARVEEGNTTRNQQLLRREYDIMRSIDSIYVVRPWQMTDVPGIGTAIVMEYVHGRTMDAFVQEKPSFSERRRVAEELMEALESLHGRQIVHGDLKGSNILISETGNHVRLIDFGFADTDAYIAKNIGTSPSIQSPEPSADACRETADIQRDIYALGKILSLLFPYRFRLIRKRCLHNRYQSVSDVRKAIRRHVLWSRLIPVIAIVLMVVLAAVGWHRTVDQETVPVLQKDTIVVTTLVIEPQADSTWLTIREQAAKKYNRLYRVYTDSLKNMAEPDRTAGIEMIGRYAARVVEQRDRLITAHPEYEEQLREQELLIYTRDEPRLEEIIKEYPIIYYNLNGEKIIIQ